MALRLQLIVIATATARGIQDQQLIAMEPRILGTPIPMYVLLVLLLLQQIISEPPQAVIETAMAIPLDHQVLQQIASETAAPAT